MWHRVPVGPGPAQVAHRELVLLPPQTTPELASAEAMRAAGLPPFPPGCESRMLSSKSRVVVPGGWRLPDVLDRVLIPDVAQRPPVVYVVPPDYWYRWQGAQQLLSPEFPAYVVPIQADCRLLLPQPLRALMGWRIGDELTWLGYPWGQILYCQRDFWRCAGTR